MSDSNAVTKHAEAPAALAQPSEIGAMLHLAIERGIDVEALERLQAMYERSQDRQAREEYNAALARFHAACPTIKKNKTAKITSKKTGMTFAYSFASLDEMVRVIRPLLAANDLSFSWDTTWREDKSAICVCTIRHVGGHSESAVFPIVVEGDGRMSAAQSAGSALTFARRYSLTSALGLTTGDADDDGLGGGGDSPVQSEPLSQERRDELLQLASELDAGEFDACLEWLGVTAFAELPSSLYARAKRGIEAKVAAKKAKGGAA